MFQGESWQAFGNPIQDEESPTFLEVISQLTYSALFPYTHAEIQRDISHALPSFALTVPSIWNAHPHPLHIQIQIPPIP